MFTLLKETLEAMASHKKTPEDVKFITVEDSTITWKQFEQLANEAYDNGYGSANVNTSLKVVGNNWWLERHEYDGSEWWEFKSVPKKKNEFVSDENLHKVEIFYK